jgi:hypothetical protein
MFLGDLLSPHSWMPEPRRQAGLRLWGFLRGDDSRLV